MLARPAVDFPEEVISPDLVLPSQFARLWHESRSMTPEQRLAFGVLWRTILDLRKHRHARSRKHQRLYMDAYEWVAADEPGHMFSFIHLCEVFGLSPDLARAQLLDVTKDLPDIEAESDLASLEDAA